MAEISINFTSKGADKTLKELEGINTNAAKATDNLFQMAKVLKTASNISLANTANALAKIGKDSQGAAKQFEDLGKSTKNVQDRLKEYTAAQAKLGQTLDAPATAIKELTAAFGKLPQQIQPVAARFQELQKAGLDASQTFKVLRQELGTTEKQFAALTTAANQATKAQEKVTSQVKELAKANKEVQQSTAKGQKETEQYTASQQKLSQTLNAPLKAVNELTAAFGKLPNAIQPVAVRFMALQREGIDAAESFRILQKELGVTEKQFAALTAAANQTAKAQAQAVVQVRELAKANKEAQRSTAQGEKEAAQAAIASAKAVAQAQKEAAQVAIAQAKAVAQAQKAAQEEVAKATLAQSRAAIQAQKEAQEEANRAAIAQAKTLAEIQKQEQKAVADAQKEAARAASAQAKAQAQEQKEAAKAAAAIAKAEAQAQREALRTQAQAERQARNAAAAQAKAQAKAERDEQRAAAAAQKQAQQAAIAQARALAQANRDAQRAAAQAQKEVQKSVTDTAKELAVATREAQKLTNALNKGQQVPVEEVTRVANQLAEAQRNAAKLAAQFDLSEKQARQLGTNVERAKRSTVELSKAADTATQDFSEALDFAGAIGAALAAAGAAILAVGAEAFLSFENAAKQFNILSSASGATAEQIKAVEVESKLLGATTAFTAADVQNLAVELTRMGVNAEDIEASLSGIVAGSLATGEDLSRIGEVTGRALTQFQLSGDQAVRVVDILGVTAANSATDVDQVGEALSYVGGQANASNQSIETTSLLLGLLANAGITGSRAGTNLGAVFDNLKKGSADLANGLDSDAARAFQSLGVDIREADGSLKDFGEILPELRQNFSALTVQQQENIETSLFGERGGRAFTALMQASDESVQQLSRSIAESGGFSEDAAEQMRQGLSGALIELSSATEAATSTIFATFAPAAEAVVRAATALLSGFTQLPAPLQLAITSAGSFVAILGAATAAVAAYNAMQGPMIVTQLLAARVQAQKNLATAAEIVVQKAATVATKARTLSEAAAVIMAKQFTIAQVASSAATLASNLALNAQSVALGSAAAAQKIYEVATGKGSAAALKFAAASLKALLPLAALVGAIAAVGANVAIFNDLTAANREVESSIQGSSERLVELQKLIAEVNNQPVDEVIADEALLNIQALQDEFNIATRAVDFLTERIFGIPSATDAAVSRSTVAFGKLIEQTGKVEEEILNLLFALEDGEIIPPEVAEASINALEEEIKTLEESRPVTEQDIQIKEQRIRQLENTIRLIEENSGVQRDNTNAVEEGTTAAEANAQALQRIQNELAQRNAELQRDAAQRRAELAESGVGGEEFARRNEEIERESLERRLQINQQYLNDLRRQAANDPGNQEVQDALLDAETEYYDTRAEIAENAREEAERIEKERQDALKEALELAQAEVDRANVERQRSILELEQQLRASGLTEEEIAEQTAQATLDIERQSIEDRIKLQQELIEGTERGSTERAQAEIQLAELQNDLLANQIAAERQFREAQKQAEERAQEEAIKAIEEEIAANQRLVNEQVAGAESRLRAQERIEDSLERQNKLLQQQRNLNTAISALRDAVGNRQVAQANSALEVQRELARVTEELDTNSELSAEERERLTNQRLQLERQLGRLGIERGITEQEALQRVIAAQARRFAQERQALNRQQAIERSTLELEIQRNRIAAERAVREQEIALRRLDLQRQEILGEIEIARIRGDEQAALDAESRLRILDDVILGEQDLLRIQQEAAATEAQSAEVQRQTLAAQQQAAQLSLAEQQEQRALELAREAATVGGTAQSQAEALANQTANRATAEAQAASALAASLDNTVQLNQQTETLLTQTRALADEAERYRRAIGGSSATPGNVPSFKVGGIAPGGLTQVHKDEFIYLPQGAQIASQRLSRQAQRQIAQAGALAQTMGNLSIGSLPNVLAHPKIELRSKDMELLRRDFQKLAKILERQGPPRIDLEQTFVGEVETSVKRASEDVWRIGHRMGIL